MDWLDKMNAALDYIEANLAGEIDFAVAARGACCSEYHFTRMFSFITDVPLSEYIRRRRLTLAGFELKHSDIKVIDLANKYGYDSPSSFTRAFQIMHGVTPTEARTLDARLKSFARISFIISIKGDAALNYRIVEKGPFTVLGKSVEVSVVGGQCFREIPAFWNRCEEDQTTLRIAKAGGGNEHTLLCSSMYAHDPCGTFRYMICTDAPDGHVPDEFERLDIPALTWAVFTTEGVEDVTAAIQDIWKRVHPEWFPSSGYEHANAPDQERYRAVDGKFVGEAWVPVVKCGTQSQS